MKKIVYIAGPITGVPEYYKPFEQAMDELQAAGMIPLSPCWMPEDLPREKCIALGLAMLTQADAALFLPGWEASNGCELEMEYCENTRKQTAELTSMHWLSDAVRDLKEALDAEYVIGKVVVRIHGEVDLKEALDDAGTE